MWWSWDDAVERLQRQREPLTSANWWHRSLVASRGSATMRCCPRRTFSTVSLSGFWVCVCLFRLQNALCGTKFCGWVLCVDSLRWGVLWVDGVYVCDALFTMSRWVRASGRFNVCTILFIYIYRTYMMCVKGVCSLRSSMRTRGDWTIWCIFMMVFHCLWLAVKPQSSGAPKNVRYRFSGHWLCHFDPRTESSNHIYILIHNFTMMRRIARNENITHSFNASQHAEWLVIFSCMWRRPAR